MYECLGSKTAPLARDDEDLIKRSFEENFNMKLQTLLTSYGELVMLASTVVENIDPGMTLFDQSNEES